ALGLVAPPDPASLAQVERGREVFARIGCANCHRPEIQLASSVYEEPSSRGNGNYADPFLLGKDADYDPLRPARIDLARDAQAPRVEAAAGGGYVVRLYGDLKRHHMGRHLADAAGPQPPVTSALAPLQIDGQMSLIQADEFLTAELWGVGNTGPYLHDGRAGSLGEAIELHGEDSAPSAGDPGRGEAQEARDAYKSLAAEEQGAVVTFLKSLVNFSPEG
ncbi:MAG TPA: di-heme oxidoredictase family protein, partial [Thermoanaerobaculia bacterium]|nr:di-heme oxidoredictase family protein [Thermoanaerobaculia bacterium]